MDLGEGAPVVKIDETNNPLQSAKAHVAKTAHAVKQRLTEAWLGKGDLPDDLAKRTNFKRAVGTGTAIAVAVAEHTFAVRALVTGAELIKFTDVPNFRSHEYYKTATRDIHHTFTDSAVFEDKNDQGIVIRRYVPSAYLSFGDSLAWGFVEKYDEHGRIIVDPSRVQRCSTDTFCADMNNAGAEIQYSGTNDNKVTTERNLLPVDFEHENLSYPGSTIDDIAGQIQQLSKNLGDHPEQYPPIAFDSILAVGGNNALNYLAANLSPDVAVKFTSEFIPQFKNDMSTLMNKIIALRTQGKDSPFLKSMKHLIVSSVPNLGASDQLFYIPPANKKIEKPEDIPPAVAVPMIPALRDLASAACQHMNNAILDVIQKIQEDHPDFEIHFEDIFGVPVHGIHPTEDGYAQIASKRERQNRAEFYVSPMEETKEMTYDEFVTMKRLDSLTQSVI